MPIRNSMKKKLLSGKKSGCLATRMTGQAKALSPSAAWLTLGAMSFLACDATAVGFRLPNQDPEGIARGNAFAATADNPSAIYYNPAGITQLEGQNLSAGLYLISAGVKYQGPGNASAASKTDFQPVPQFYYVNAPKDSPFALGLGVYVPYGLGMDYGNSSVFRNVAQNGHLLYATVNPVAAWKITPELSIAAGPTINYSKVDFNQGLGLPGFSQFHFVGDDYAFGFNAGARYQPIKQLAFGVNYRYQTDMNYQGHSSAYVPGAFNFASTTSASIHFPQFVAGGISYRPTENWNIEFDLDWTDWNSVKQATFNGTVFGTPIPNLAFNYRSSFMYEFGVTRQLPKGYFVSAGYIYSENSSPDANFNPLIPDSNLHLFSVGTGHKGRRFGWAVSYTVAYQPNRTVSGSSFNNPLTPGTTVDGNYRVLNNAINASVSLKF
ncbi:MAG: Membrane protein involved in aromatic hydrocarbon degradation [Pedosphaera sp.]|nr:Membrane protein involved in aromatic hydrocarbon degradation [Pedosphaera sp.]